MKNEELALYRDLLGEVKTRVRAGQHRAALSANAELIAMYWDIGRMIAARQKTEGWGAGVIPRLATDLKNELPEEKGFSERNIGYMVRFAREYGPPPILQQPAAKLQTTENQWITIVPRVAAQIPNAEQMRAQPAPQISSVEIVPQPVDQTETVLGSQIRQRAVTQQLKADQYTQFERIGPLRSGQRSEPISARSADGLKVRLRAGKSIQRIKRGLKVRANHPRAQAPGICADPATAGPATPWFSCRNPARNRVPLARNPVTDRAGIGSDLRPEMGGKDVHTRQPLKAEGNL